MCLNLGKEIALTVGRGEEVYIPASQSHSVAELCVSPIQVLLLLFLLFLWALSIPYLANIGKDPVAGQDWRQKEKRMTEDKMVGWHHRFDGHEFE